MVSLTAALRTAPSALPRAALAAAAVPRVVSRRAFATGGGGGFAFAPSHRRERLPMNVGFVIVPQQKAYIVERCVGAGCC